MKMNDWGEDPLIQYIQQQFMPEKPLVGIGDDCAVIPTGQTTASLITTDALVEGVHFIKEQVPPIDVGFKSIAVNVSDIAAMGGEPKFVFLSIAIPKTTNPQWVKDFFKGIRIACDEFGVELLGGDTVGSLRDIFINITLTGTMAIDNVKYRHTAKAGDVICVTGFLGDSGAGLQALQEGLDLTEEVKNLIAAHVHPIPQPEEGKWLAKHQGVHAMMDVSDGLDIDLNRLLKASEVHGVVDVSNIPISETLKTVCYKNNWDPLKFALTGGEDYCLLLTVDPNVFTELQSEFHKVFGRRLYKIGHVIDKHEVHSSVRPLTYMKDGNEMKLEYRNFDHFQ